MNTSHSFVRWRAVLLNQKPLVLGGCWHVNVWKWNKIRNLLLSYKPQLAHCEVQIQNTPSLHAVLLGGASGPSHCERVYSGGKRNRQTGGADQRKVSYSCDVGKQLHHLFKEKERANIGELTLRQLLPRQVSLVEWSFFPSSHHLPHCFPVHWTKGIAFKSRRLRIGTAEN